MKADMLIVHGGAPTAVMNASLYGAIKAAQESGEVGRILGARGGSRAILRGDFLDLSALDEETLELLPSTPASYIGTSRDPIEKEEYARIVDILLEKHIRYVLFNGGNGSMDSCGKLAHAADPKPQARDLRIARHSQDGRQRYRGDGPTRRVSGAPRAIWRLPSPNSRGMSRPCRSTCASSKAWAETQDG